LSTGIIHYYSVDIMKISAFSLLNQEAVTSCCKLLQYLMTFDRRGTRPKGSPPSFCEALREAVLALPGVGAEPSEPFEGKAGQHESTCALSTANSTPPRPTHSTLHSTLHTPQSTALYNPLRNPHVRTQYSTIFQGNSFLSPLATTFLKLGKWTWLEQKGARWCKAVKKSAKIAKE